MFYVNCYAAIRGHHHHCVPSYCIGLDAICNISPEYAVFS